MGCSYEEGRVGERLVANAIQPLEAKISIWRVFYIDTRLARVCSGGLAVLSPAAVRGERSGAWTKEYII